MSITAHFSASRETPVLPGLDRALLAADRIDITELGARFDNGLDSEDLDKFAGVFTENGVLAGFWGEAAGREQIAGAFHFMLSTFARNRRHFVGNHEVTVDGDSATMYSYMVVLDRATNSSIGTATFTDVLARTANGWRFVRRTLSSDANVQPIIDQLTVGRH
jgi:uncharacterized protein (TIGR02246 family)